MKTKIKPRLIKGKCALFHLGLCILFHKTSSWRRLLSLFNWHEYFRTWHETVTKNFGAVAGKGGDSDVISWINNALPALHMHLDSLKTIQKG